MIVLISYFAYYCYSSRIYAAFSKSKYWPQSLRLKINQKIRAKHANSGKQWQKRLIRSYKNWTNGFTPLSLEFAVDRVLIWTLITFRKIVFIFLIVLLLAIVNNRKRRALKINDPYTSVNFQKTLQHACFSYESPPSNLMIVGVEK